MSRLAIMAALEALEAGDTRLVAEILLGELEEDESAGAGRHRCGCGNTYEWPGLLEAHRLSGVCPTTLGEAA